MTMDTSERRIETSEMTMDVSESKVNTSEVTMYFLERKVDTSERKIETFGFFFGIWLSDAGKEVLRNGDTLI